MAVGVNTTHRMVVLALGALRDDALPLSHHGLSGLLLAHLQLGIRVFVRASTLKNLKSLHSSTNVQRLRPAPSPACCPLQNDDQAKGSLGPNIPRLTLRFVDAGNCRQMRFGKRSTRSSIFTLLHLSRLKI